MRSETEKGFQKAFVQYARLRGWLVYHPRPAWVTGKLIVTPFDGDPGFPDTVCVRDGVCLVVELKVGKNRPTEAQTRWIDAFARVPGVVARVLYPADWPEIEQLLGAPPGRPEGAG